MTLATLVLILYGNNQYQRVKKDNEELGSRNQQKPYKIYRFLSLT